MPAKDSKLCNIIEKRKKKNPAPSFNGERAGERNPRGGKNDETRIPINEKLPHLAVSETAWQSCLDVLSKGKLVNAKFWIQLSSSSQIPTRLGGKVSKGVKYGLVLWLLLA